MHVLSANLGCDSQRVVVDVRHEDAALIADAPAMAQELTQLQRDKESLQRLVADTEATARAALDLLRELADILPANTEQEQRRLMELLEGDVERLLAKHGRG